MAPRTHTLRAPPTPEDDSWQFDNVPPFFFAAQGNRPSGKFVKFTPGAITLQFERFSMNRILHNDDPSQFILVSFAEFRSEVFRGRIVGEYIFRFLKAGLFLNGRQYRFYHHSNSQLRGRSCFLRRADSDAELDARIYQMGDFGKIMNAAKRAKRIGLLFSAADIDYQLDPARTADIRDLKIGDELFSDGCGLMSRRLAVNLSKIKRIIFRNSRYTPCVFQIRYRGYKGVLSLHPQLDREQPNVLAQFRDSMKKFNATLDNTFSVVDYSKPYAFGRLNNDIIVLLSSLGITNEKLLAKQQAYFSWIEQAATDVNTAVDLLSCMGQFALAEKVLLDGLDDPGVQGRIRGLQSGEVAGFRKNDKIRCRTMVHKSRLLFGICDPHGVLNEGEVHVCFTSSRQGATSLHAIDVLVVRNPCLHPGDCLKLRAVGHPALAHLVDCVVFPATGKRAAPSMTSGGDLDGDKFLICWDPDLVPTRLMKSYGYPGNKEHFHPNLKREDLAKHFSSYNSSGLARVANLHQRWAYASPDGAACSECLELNALHSQSVDGAAVKIPDRLSTPPTTDEPFIIELLAEQAREFAERFVQTHDPTVTEARSITDVPRDPATLIVTALTSKLNAISEYELFNVAAKLARKHGVDLRPFLPHIDFGALNTEQKYAIAFALGTTLVEDRYIWNSLFRSNILTTRDLEMRELDRPLRLQRLFTSLEHGTAAFFEYLQRATLEYTRKLIILKTDDRFAVGIFIRGDIPWDEDPEVDENVVVCSFLPKAAGMMSTYRPCTRGYRLHCSDGNLQLYDKQRVDTFIFLTRPAVQSGAHVAASIALQKISGRVQKQIGRLNRSPVIEIEIHVVSNRDRVAHQLFDLRFEHVQTEIVLPHQNSQRRKYVPNTLADMVWSEQPEWMQWIFNSPPNESRAHLINRTMQELDALIIFCVKFHAEDQVFWAFNEIISREPLATDSIQNAVEVHPPLVFALLKTYPPDEDCALPETIASLAAFMVRILVKAANVLGMAVLVALEKMSGSINLLGLDEYIHLIELASLCIRPPNVVQEALLVLNDVRSVTAASSRSIAYAQKHALAVAFDRAEEAADECPCDEDGRPRKQGKGKAPPRVRLHGIENDDKHVRADVRIDLPSDVRLHSLVRLQSTSTPEKGWRAAWMMDGLVVEAGRGDLKIELLHPSPSEMEDMDWLLYNAGSIATSRAMMDAVLKISTGGAERCRFAEVILQGGRPTAGEDNSDGDDTSQEDDKGEPSSLNESQKSAVRACRAPLSLIWGPPGTGKTTVVVQILRSILREGASLESKILVTASTHNAVDNILERFVEMNNAEKLIRDDTILRVATDRGKVNKKLQSYTVDARVGGDLTQDVRLLSKAQKRVKEARIVFTTCAGAGLGTLRSLDFDIVVIDEASQITEPCALIPLVKGCRRAVIVGDHVQLRPTVRPMAKALEHDKSLLERLYTDASVDVPRTMLDVQYRFPKELAAFPSAEFYDGRLRTGTENSAAALAALEGSAFPWPRRNGAIVPIVFVPCAAEEDMGGASKANTGQARLVAHIVNLLHNAKTAIGDEEHAPHSAGDAAPRLRPLGITALTPYAKQAKALQSAIAARHDVACGTIDAFQGRENDVIVLSTVRSNAEHEIGFVEDPRRLNVAWTRARHALIVVGDRATLMAKSALWARALAACVEVSIVLPEE